MTAPANAFVAKPERPASVLLVDDDDVFRRGCARALRAAGMEVVEAANGRDAVAAFQRAPTDVILTDIYMPDLDGIDLVSAIRKEDRDVAIVVLTGAPSVETASEAVSLGAFRYLVKPVLLDVLENTLAQAVEFGKLARLKRQAFEAQGAPRARAEHAELHEKLESALGGMWMAYQPIVSWRERRAFGYEGLLRSREPALPHPGAVLDAADRLDRVSDVTRRVFELVGRPLAAPDSPDALLFVNMPATELSGDRLFSEDNPLASIANRVVLEVTERSSLDGVPDLRAKVERLRAAGYRIALDDLGAGYAGLTSFMLLQPDVAKIDMTLVRSIEKEPLKQKLVSTVVDLCRATDTLVVAEGVETPAERDCLVGLGVDLLQGYLFARPAPPFPAIDWNA